MTLEQFQLFFSFYKCWVLTYKPSAMHSNSRVSPLRTILVLVDPIGYINPGWWSPSGLSEGTRTITSQTESFSYWHPKELKHIIKASRGHCEGKEGHVMKGFENWERRQEDSSRWGVCQNQSERWMPLGVVAVGFYSNTDVPGQKQPPPGSHVSSKRP